MVKSGGQYHIVRKLEFDAAHRVLKHESKCGTLHGHRYTVQLEVSATELDGVGRVIDFGVLKGIVGRWLDDHFDHTTIVNEDDSGLLEFCLKEHGTLGKKPPYIIHGEPTAENIAKEIFEQAEHLLAGADRAIRVEKVTLYETPNCWAVWGR